MAASIALSGANNYMCLPTTEEFRDEDNFINQNDHRRDFIPIEEISWTASFYGDHDYEDDDERGFVERLISQTLTDEQLLKAAQVAAEEPRIIVILYRQAMNPEGVYGKMDRADAREKIIGLIRRMVSTMIGMRTKKQINRSLLMRCDGETGLNLLACLARLARWEMKKKASLDVAPWIIRMLGHDDVYALYHD